METNTAFSGIVVRVLRVESSASKANKVFRTLITEADGKWKQVIPFKVFGHVAEVVGELDPGSMVKISGRLGGREWNGRVFGEMVAESIELLEQARPSEALDKPGNEPQPDDSSIPF